MMKYYKLLFLFVWFPAILTAQQDKPELSFSLDEAIAYAMENNYRSLVADKGVDKALKQKWEIIAQGLPQLSGNTDYTNFLKQPVTLLPAELADGPPGEFIPVRFGTKQNITGTATWNQLIFDGSYIVGVQSAKTLLQISRNAKTKTDQSVKEAVINAYGNVLLASESVKILDRNIETVEKNLQETREIYKNGFVEEEDVEQLQLTLLSLQNNLNRSRRLQEISLEMFNLSLGIPVETAVSLKDNLDKLVLQNIDLNLLNTQVQIEETIDYRIAQNRAESADIFVKLEKAKALPSITGFVNYGFQGFSDSFSFFEEDQEYFTQSILGVNLNIPIFSSGLRSSRTQQKKIEHEQALIELEETKNSVKLEINSARTDYRFSLENYEIQQKNVSLAERIEEKNRIKFFEGLASSFELSEAQRQLYTAQQELLQSMFEVISNKAALEKLLDTTQYEKN